MVVIDTSVLIELLDRGMPSLAFDSAATRLRLPPIVAAEILSGRLTVGERARLEGFLSGIIWCAADADHWFRVGSLRSNLSARGVTLTAPDAHIAQCALDLGAELWTLDRVFDRVARHVPLRLGRGALDA